MRSDYGLFGPSSVTWHLHADPAVWIGGISSLHLQALHPIAALGIVQNSSFTTSPRRRLAETGKWIVTVTWGSTVQAERMARRLRAIHAAMSIRDAAGTWICRLDEPDLLLWVHGTHVWSNLAAVGRARRDLSAADADRYVREQRRTAELVGLRAASVPASVGELEDYLTGMAPLLSVTPAAAQISAYLFRPALGGADKLLRPAWRAASQLAYSIMPYWARQRYRRPGWPEAVANHGLRLLRQAALLVPWQVRLSFPEPVLAAAVAQLGPAGVPRCRSRLSRAAAVPNPRSGA